MDLKKHLKLSMTAAMLVAFGAVSIVTAQEREAAKPEPMDISGLIFMNWHTGLTGGKNGVPGNETNTFEFERLYLNWQKKLDNIFSARVTIDVSNEGVIEGATPAASSSTSATGGSNSSKYRLFVKYAWLQAKNSFGPVESTLKAGMLDTPAIGFVDGLNDQRWLHKNFFDDTASILPTGKAIDNSADMGLSLSANLVKLVELNLALTNGEGFKNANEGFSSSSSDNSKNTAQGKAYYARLTLTPLNTLYISGFYKLEGTSVNEQDNNRGYYGAGAAWKSDLIKAGANYIMPFQKLNGQDIEYGSGGLTGGKTGDKVKQSILEAWLTLSTQRITMIPLLIMARYAYGDDSDQNDAKTTYMGAGIGYEFNSNLRVAAWYDQFDSDARDAADTPNPLKTFWVKAEIKI